MPLVDYLGSTEASSLVELYKFSIGQDSYFYTSYESDYTFDGDVYSSVPIENKGFSEDNNLKTNSLKISISLSTEAKRYIANSPMEPCIVEITWVLLENPTVFETYYKGRVISIDITEESASLGLENYTDIFRVRVPKIIHSSVCNNILFDSVCGLNKLNYEVDAVISGIVDNCIYSSVFSGFANGYFTRGVIKTNYGDMRMITNHINTEVCLHVPFDSRFSVGSSVLVYPGCDRARDTCINKFSNIDNYLGMPEIPSHNPAVWGIEGAS